MTARIIHMHLQRLEAREDGLASLTKAELDELIWPGAFSFDGAASLAGWVGTHGWPRRRLPRKRLHRSDLIRSEQPLSARSRMSIWAAAFCGARPPR